MTKMKENNTEGQNKILLKELGNSMLTEINHINPSFLKSVLPIN